MSTTKEKITVIQHFENGGEVEIGSGNKWTSIPDPSWDWMNAEYRIKEKPKTVTLYYYLITKGSPSLHHSDRGSVVIKTHMKNFSLGNPTGHELIKTETIEVQE